MRIAVLTSSYPRFPGDGTAPFVKSLAESMARRGHDITVVAPYDPAIQPDLENSVKVYRFRYIWPPRWHIMGHARSLESDVRLKLGTYFLLPLFLLAAFIKLMRVTREQNSEIIHAHWVLPNGPAAALTSKLRGIPLVISLHGSDIYVARKKRIFSIATRWVFRQTSAVTACSTELRSAAIGLGAPQTTQLIAWGADPHIFQPKPASVDSSNETITIASLGRMVPKKGFEKLLFAWKKIAAEFPQARLIIGGEGPQRADLKFQAAQLGLDHSIQLPGYIPWNTVPDFLASADIFVLPSQRDEHGNIDGLPTVLLEAMSCGVAIIASDLGGVHLVVKDGHNGIIVPPGNTSALKQALRTLIESSQERKRLGLAARQAVTNQYNWEKVAQKFMTLFQNAANNKAYKQPRLGSIYRVEMLKLLGQYPKGGCVLDVGCHDGYFLYTLNADLRVGIDLDPQPNYTDTVNYVCADGCALPFAPGTFDHIYALDVLEHIPDDDAFSRSLIEILDQRGQIIITTPSETIRLTPRWLTDWIGQRWGHTLRAGYSPSKLRALFRLENLCIVIQSWNAPWYRFWYLSLRTLQTILPRHAIRLGRTIALLDSHHTIGQHGFYLIKITPINNPHRNQITLA